jgi:hypothetical protein
VDAIKPTWIAGVPCCDPACPRYNVAPDRCALACNTAVCLPAVRAEHAEVERLKLELAKGCAQCARTVGLPAQD